MILAFLHWCSSPSASLAALQHLLRKEIRENTESRSRANSLTSRGSITPLPARARTRHFDGFSFIMTNPARRCPAELDAGSKKIARGTKRRTAACRI